jgi:mRNA-degrading endonuclease toxin of MazEF toxin-antitoxin module
MINIKNLKNEFDNIVLNFEQKNSYKIFQYLKQIPKLCALNNLSAKNRELRTLDTRHFHPVKVFRGEIHNANITEGVGSELSGDHLIIIIQNKTSNIFGEKVTILPIEGDGNIIDLKYQMQLSNDDLIDGHLDKNPSRIIISDIITIDKSRLQRKIGTIKSTKMIEINERLRKQLQL